MTEAQVGLLYNIASSLSKSQKNSNNDILKSYYLMRCKNVTRGYGLPDKHFSPKIRCPKCCMEWTKDTEIKVRSIKLSKRQKHRLKSSEITYNKKEYVKHRKDLLSSNEVEQTCKFCKKSTITPVLKPQKQELKTSSMTQKAASVETIKPAIAQKVEHKKVKHKEKVNVNANAMNVFSLNNKNNTLARTIKEKPKPINNNKKKKDKFAGLCQKAVLASAKVKEKKQNILNLFLKPSSN